MVPKVTQAQLADKLGVSFQQVQKYEKGVNRLTAAMMVRIAEVLKVDVQYFFDELPTRVKNNGAIKTPVLVEMSLAGSRPSPDERVPQNEKRQITRHDRRSCAGARSSGGDIGATPVALARPAGAGYAASLNWPGDAKRMHHAAAMVILPIVRLALGHVPRLNTRMSDTRIDFSAPATLRKWPSLNNERVSASLGGRTYMIIEGTLDECIRKFMLQPKSQRHLYEIHTVPQTDLVGAILSTDHVVELARLRDFLGK